MASTRPKAYPPSASPTTPYKNHRSRRTLTLAISGVFPQSAAADVRWGEWRRRRGAVRGSSTVRHEGRRPSVEKPIGGIKPSVCRSASSASRRSDREARGEHHKPLHRDVVPTFEPWIGIEPCELVVEVLPRRAAARPAVECERAIKSRRSFAGVVAFIAVRAPLPGRLSVP
jgi:hypothetical protein